MSDLDKCSTISAILVVSKFDYRVHYLCLFAWLMQCLKQPEYYISHEITLASNGMEGECVCLCVWIQVNRNLIITRDCDSPCCNVSMKWKYISYPAAPASSQHNNHQQRSFPQPVIAAVRLINRSEETYFNSLSLSLYTVVFAVLVHMKGCNNMCLCYVSWFTLSSISYFDGLFKIYLKLQH